jgi:hypothetical protein
VNNEDESDANSKRDGTLIKIEEPCFIMVRSFVVLLVRTWTAGELFGRETMRRSGTLFRSQPRQPYELDVSSPSVTAPFITLWVVCVVVVSSVHQQTIATESFESGLSAGNGTGVNKKLSRRSHRKDPRLNPNQFIDRIAITPRDTTSRLSATYPIRF